MADIVACLVTHCRADATLTGLVPSAQIVRNFRSSTTLPQLYFVPRGGDERASAAGGQMISILCMAVSPATCSAVHDRLRQLFHQKSNYTLGASPNTVTCHRSERVSLPDEMEYEEPAAHEWQAFYEFTVLQPHGF